MKNQEHQESLKDKKKLDSPAIFGYLQQLGKQMNSTFPLKVLMQ
jgi:hypothetical protein